jgi:hypothetical protein
MDFKDGWNDLKDWVRDGLSYMNELSVKYALDNNGKEVARIERRRIEYKNFLRKIEEIEKVIE